jgi:hypothetical protein
VRQGKAGSGKVRQAWFGEVVTGEVRYGEVWQAWRGKARLGMVRHGGAWFGMVSSGRRVWLR